MGFGWMDRDTRRWRGIDHGTDVLANGAPVYILAAQLAWPVVATFIPVLFCFRRIRPSQF